MYASVALAGAAYAGMQALPMAMLPDVISHDAHGTAGPGKGVFGGVVDGLARRPMAVGAAALTVVLTVTGYVESVAGVEVEQFTSAITGIAMSFGVAPAVLALLSLLFVARYRLRRADIDGRAAEAAG